MQKYSPGSLKQLLSVSYPLMLSSLSFTMMIFVDRLLLANYSQEAFNAAVTASTAGWAFIFGAMTIGMIAEVFVAQYNGAKRFHKLGEPVWQMIWFGVFTIVLFVPLSFLGPEIMYGQGIDRQQEKDYFTWMVIFGPTYVIFGALSGFYIGQGKTAIISILAFLTNFVNWFFDMIMIFGVEGWFPAMGVKGAAIATSFSSVFQMCVLFYLFLRRHHRENHGTARWHFQLKPFLQCLKIGSPGGIANFIEIFGWSIFYEMLTYAGPNYITAGGVFQSLLILLYFFSEGLCKGVIAVCGNLIGAEKKHLIPTTVKNGLLLLFGFFSLQLVFYPAYVDPIIEIFVDVPFETITGDFLSALRFSVGAVMFYLFFDGIRFIYSGVLTAAGDTLFILIAGVLTIWAFVVAPTYYFVVLGNASIEQATLIEVNFAFLASLVYYIRYRQGRWKQIIIT